MKAWKQKAKQQKEFHDRWERRHARQKGREALYAALAEIGRHWRCQEAT